MEQNLVNLRNWVVGHRKHGKYVIYVSDIVHRIDSEIEKATLKLAQQSDKEEKLNSAEKEDAVSPTGNATEQSTKLIERLEKASLPPCGINPAELSNLLHDAAQQLRTFV